MPDNGPLPTDEHVPGRKRDTDLDTVLLRGCGLFVVVSFSTLILSAWPYIVFGDLATFGGLARAAAFGLLPAWILGIVAAIRTETVGAAGFVGGALSVAIFLYLRLQQVALGYEIREVPKPEFAPAMVWMYPLAWLVVSLASVSLISLAKMRE
jgi:hypothetical protein